MLGVIIGTGAVIGVGSIIAGLDGAITGLLRSFGPNTVIVTKTTAMGNATREERRRKPLTLENARAIAERCPVGGARQPVTCLPPERHPQRRVQRQRPVQHSDWAARKKATPPAAPPCSAGRFFTDRRTRTTCRSW